MQRVVIITTIALALTSSVSSSQTDEFRPYRHPQLDFQLTAPAGWENQPRPEDYLIYEIADPSGDVHAVLWFTATQQDAKSYLVKMSHMKDLVPDAEAQRRQIDDREAWVLDGFGLVGGDSVRTLLAVIHGGAAAAHRDHNEFYVLEIWCPVADYPQQADRMARILTSARITDRIFYQGKYYPLYPDPLGDASELPSPLISDRGRECVIVETQRGARALIDVTVERGMPLNYSSRQWGKGDQLLVAAAEFPSLARTGLHDTTEVEGCATITGLPVASITAAGQPGQASGSGFLAAGEDLLQVLAVDNRQVAQLGLSHPQLAHPLFVTFNLAQRQLECARREHVAWNDLTAFYYNGHRISFRASGSKGWQKSIFSDEVLGYYQFDLGRELEPAEIDYLEAHYSELEASRRAELRSVLSTIHTGEMVPFYIMRYGFYEGHVPYRADPVAIASVFGLLSVAEIDSALGGDLPAIMIR